MVMTPRKRWLIILGCWTVLYVFLALGEAADQAGKLHPLSTGQVFVREALTDVWWVPLTYLVLWFARRVPIAAPRRLPAFVTHLAASLGVAAAHIATVGVLFALFGFEIDGAG